MDENLKSAYIAKAKEYFAAILKDEGATVLKIEYTGEGDSGSPCEVSLLNGDVYLDGDLNRTRTQPVLQFHWNDGSHSYSLDECVNSRDGDGVEEVLDAILRFSGHGGYEINEGGGGTLTFKLADMSLQLDHYDNIVTTEESSHAF